MVVLFKINALYYLLTARVGGGGVFEHGKGEMEGGGEGGSLAWWLASRQAGRQAGHTMCKQARGECGQGAFRQILDDIFGKGRLGAWLGKGEVAPKCITCKEGVPQSRQQKP